MPTLEDLADRVERLLLRYEEVKRTNALLEQQLTSVVTERDNLRVRLGAARSRIDELIDRLPIDPLPSPQGDGAASFQQREGSGS